MGAGLSWVYFTCLTSFKYSATSLTITSGLLHCPPCLTKFLLFHRLHVVIAKRSQSTPRQCSFISHTMSRMFKWGSGREWSLVFVALHTAAATLQPHNMCPEDSHSPHRSQLSSCSIPFAFNRSFVGQIFLTALHMKCLILLGQFKF